MYNQLWHSNLGQQTLILNKDKPLQCQLHVGPVQIPYLLVVQFWKT